MADLFADTDEEELTLKTKNEYAKRYDTWREKEELHKLEQKYGENPTEADLEDSDSEDEEEEPPEVSEKLEKDFLKTLSLLKKKDPRIYDPGFKFFEEGDDKDEKKREGDLSVAEKPKKAVESLAQAFGASDDESEGEIFTVEKPIEEPEEKEDKLKEFLTGKAEHLEDETEADLQALKALWSDPKLNEGEAFLRDYILNRKYLAEEDEGPSDKLLDDADLEADARTVEEQGKFERAYNFRFEEPDQEYLKRYPRTIGGTRPKDDRRARKRAEVRERKEQEKQKKMEEIGRMKALKLKEIQEKIAKIKEVTGNQDLAFKDEDIEGDFDPAEHDRRMRAIFDEQYYDEQDSEKPVFPDLDEELEIENWNKYEEQIGIDNGSSSKDNAGPHCEDEDFNMDADYDAKRARATLAEEIQETLGKKRRNRKNKSKLAALLAKEKPKFDPATADKTYTEYMEEYYRMDCEDVIGGDLPTRFKYRDVVPNSYGLSIEEILLADDKELNKWVPLKKAVKYRPEHVEKGEVKTYQLKANDLTLKKKLIPSLFKDIEEPEVAVEGASKKKKKKKKKKQKTLESVEQEAVEPSTSAATANVSIEVNDNDTEDVKKKSKKNKKKDPSENTASANISIAIASDEVQEEGAMKLKKKKKKHMIEITDEIGTENVDQVSTNGNENLKKKRKEKEHGKDQNNYKPNNTNTSVDECITETSNKRKHQKEKRPKPNIEVDITSKDKTLKRKLPVEGNKYGKKMKFNLKNKHKTSKGITGNPLDKLSDERLKAYGLNPKKYRSFLKYKKY